MRVVTCFVDETGVSLDSTQPIFAVGILIVRDIATLTDRLHTASLNFNACVRERRLELQRNVKQCADGNMRPHKFQRLLEKTRHHEYKFTGLRDHNFNSYVALLDIAFSGIGTEFHAIFVERTPEALRRLGGAAWPAYVGVTATLLKRRIREPAFVCCDWQTRPKNQSLVLEDELCRQSMIVGCLRMTSETSCFLQVVDLLLGAVSFDWREERGLITPSKNAALRKDLVTAVTRKVGMAPGERFLEPGSVFSGRRSPMKFTVWQPKPETVSMPGARGMPRGQSPSRG
jgi:hypothetical protein